MRGDEFLNKMALVDDDLIAEAENFPQKKYRPWRKWIFMILLLTVLLLAVLFLPIFPQKPKIEEPQSFKGAESIPAEGLTGGALLFGGDLTTEYDEELVLNGNVLTSPITDNTKAEYLPVFRSLTAESSDDIYQLLLQLRDDFVNRAAAYGIDLSLGEILCNGAVYNSKKPYVSQGYALYTLSALLEYEDVEVSINVTCDGGITQVDYGGLGELYKKYFGTLPAVTPQQTETDIAESFAPAADFISRLTGRRYEIAAGDVQILSDDIFGILIFTRANCDLPDTMPDQYPVLRINVLPASEDKPTRMNISLFGTYVEYIGDYKVMTLDEAETLLEKGYFFTIDRCPVCSENVSYPALDPMEYEAVQIDYRPSTYSPYSVPFYEFSQCIDGNRYAVWRVPAVEIDGLDEYFAAHNH